MDCVSITEVYESQNQLFSYLGDFTKAVISSINNPLGATSHKDASDSNLVVNFHIMFILIYTFYIKIHIHIYTLE